MDKLIKLFLVIMVSIIWINTSFATEVSQEQLNNVGFEGTVNQTINKNLNTDAILETNNIPVSSPWIAAINQSSVKKNVIHNTGTKENILFSFLLVILLILSRIWLKKKNLI